jgi:hypothetical protein
MGGVGALGEGDVPRSGPSQFARARGVQPIDEFIRDAQAGAPNNSAAGVIARAANNVHKNSLEYVGDTHVYRIKGPDGATFKIGESAQGVRARDGASIRAEQQARKLTRETGNNYTTEIRKEFGDKASARDYETRLITRFRRMYGLDALPGNKSDR